MVLHQGLRLSPSLFAMVMDWLTDKIRQEPLWTVIFADDIVFCSEKEGEVKKVIH